MVVVALDRWNVVGAQHALEAGVAVGFMVFSYLYHLEAIIARA